MIARILILPRLNREAMMARIGGSASANRRPAKGACCGIWRRFRAYSPAAFSIASALFSPSFADRLGLVLERVLGRIGAGIGRLLVDHVGRSLGILLDIRSRILGRRVVARCECDQTGRRNALCQSLHVQIPSFQSRKWGVWARPRRPGKPGDLPASEALKAPAGIRFHRPALARAPIAGDDRGRSAMERACPWP